MFLLKSPLVPPGYIWLGESLERLFLVVLAIPSFLFLFWALENIQRDLRKAHTRSRHPRISLKGVPRSPAECKEPPRIAA